MDLKKAWGKNVKITFKDGQIIEGKAQYYSSAMDNPEGEASLSINDIVFFESEVLKIEEI